MTEIPDASEHLELVPARIVALVGNIVGHARRGRRRLAGLRRRPLGNALIIGGVVGAPPSEAPLRGLGAGGGAAFTALAAALLYGGFVAPR